ncbi:MAG: hypothetical protein IJF12_01665 [Alphaproteobacteria bacterium]|nr:hypothetical protein [Alphaproteobacteria bacterium]
MRKYFLTCAVALLATSTANATTDYAEVTAKATIQVAGTISCSDMDFGTIVMKANNSATAIGGEWSYGDDENYYDRNQILSISNRNINPRCVTSIDSSADMDAIAQNVSTPNSIYLTGTKSNDKLTVSDFTVYVDDSESTMIIDVDSALYIPANITADTYTGSFTLTVTY